MLLEEEKFGIKKFETYKKFGEKVYKIRENVLKNIKELKRLNKKLLALVHQLKPQRHLIFLV